MSVTNRKYMKILIMSKALRGGEGITKCIHVKVKYHSPAFYASECSQKRPPITEMGLEGPYVHGHDHVCSYKITFSRVPAIQISARIDRSLQG